jgi:hypothetical protein
LRKLAKNRSIKEKESAETTFLEWTAGITQLDEKKDIQTKAMYTIK